MVKLQLRLNSSTEGEWKGTLARGFEAKNRSL